MLGDYICLRFWTICNNGRYALLQGSFILNFFNFLKYFLQAAQPALLYLVPSCLLLPLGFAALRGEFSDLWNYSEEHLVEKDESDKSSKDEGSDKKKKKAANETANATSAPVGGGKAQKQENKKSK